MPTWTTKLFDEIRVGDRASLVHRVDAGDAELIAMVTGDRIGLDRRGPARARSVHAVGGRVLIWNAIGSRLPGPGAVILEEQLRFQGRIALDDVLTATLTVRSKEAVGRRIVLDTTCINQHGEVIADGTTTVECPVARATVERLGDVDVAVHRHQVFARLFARCRGIRPVVTAVVHPCDPDSLVGAMRAAERGLIVPVLHTWAHSGRAA